MNTEPSAGLPPDQRERLFLHYDRHLGQFQNRVMAHDEIEVVAWAGDGGLTVATLGMSARAQRVPQGRKCPSREPRTELLALCRPEDRDVFAALLLSLARYPEREKTFLHWWHVIPLFEPLIKGSEMMSVLLTVPPVDDESFATLEEDGRRVDFAWVVPISEGERLAAMTFGVNVLENMLQQKEVDVTDLNRRSII